MSSDPHFQRVLDEGKSRDERVKSRTGPRTRDGSVTRFVAMEGVRSPTGESERLREILLIYTAQSPMLHLTSEDVYCRYKAGGM